MAQLPRLILAEDDVELAELLVERLRKEHYSVRHVADGLSAVSAVSTERPDLVILDVMMPGIDGFEVCRRIRPDYDGPVLFLTARDDELDEVIGLELGADDYVTKPVRARVLIARIKALLRRAGRAGGQDAEVTRVEIGTLTVDSSRREVRREGSAIDITTAEFDILWELALQAGKVVSREFLYKELYDIDYDGIDRAVDVHVSKLRTKLGDDPRSPTFLKTVRGVGYQLMTVEG